MNQPKCNEQDYIQFLIASQSAYSCKAEARVTLKTELSPAHDVFNRLLNRQDDDPNKLWQEVNQFVIKNKGVQESQLKVK